MKFPDIRCILFDSRYFAHRGRCLCSRDIHMVSVLLQCFPDIICIKITAIIRFKPSCVTFVMKHLTGHSRLGQVFRVPVENHILDENIIAVYIRNRHRQRISAAERNIAEERPLIRFHRRQNSVVIAQRIRLERQSFFLDALLHIQTRKIHRIHLGSDLSDLLVRVIIRVIIQEITMPVLIAYRDRYEPVPRVTFVFCFHPTDRVINTPYRTQLNLLYVITDHTGRQRRFIIRIQLFQPFRRPCFFCILYQIIRHKESIRPCSTCNGTTQRHQTQSREVSLHPITQRFILTRYRRSSVVEYLVVLVFVLVRQDRLLRIQDHLHHTVRIRNVHIR